MTDPIRHTVVFALLPEHASPGRGYPLQYRARLEWHPADPWVVRARIGATDWDLSWELVQASLDAPAGLGDASLRPLGQMRGGARHQLGLANKTERAVLQFRTATLRSFVRAVQHVWADRPLTDDDITAFYAGQDAQ